VLAVPYFSVCQNFAVHTLQDLDGHIPERTAQVEFCGSRTSLCIWSAVIQGSPVEIQFP